LKKKPKGHWKGRTEKKLPSQTGAATGSQLLTTGEKSFEEKWGKGPGGMEGKGEDSLHTDFVLF